MKKLFFFAAALMMGTSMFASLENAPDDKTLQGYAEAGQNLVYAIYVEDSIKCNDIVLVGTYNGWTADAAACSTFVAVEGYAGWYVCCVKDETSSEGDGIEAKPVQLNGVGAFNWDHQVGKLDTTAIVRGFANITPGYSNECDIRGISDQQPFLLNVSKWKNNPCTAKFHDYVITFVSPDCNEKEWITPAISGGFNSWAQDSMALDHNATAIRIYDGLPGAVYKYTAHAEEGTQYKFRSAESWGADWSNQLREYVDSTGYWEDFNGGQNFTFGSETNLEYDLGDPTKYSWNTCERYVECDSADYVITVKFPACDSTQIPAVIGDFNSWSQGEVLTETEGAYTITVRALCSDRFKFRDEAYGWDNEIKVLDTIYGGWNTMNNITFGDELNINFDFSNPLRYKWSKCPAKVELTLQTDPSWVGYVIGGGQYEEGEWVSIAAICIEEGYHFDSWSDGSTVAGRSIYLNESKTLTAHFTNEVEKDTVYINMIEVNSMNPTMGSASIQVYAQPNDGYSFVCWSDYNTTNPRIVESSDVPQTFIAVFSGSQPMNAPEIQESGNLVMKRIANDQLIIQTSCSTYNAQGQVIK